MKHPRLCLLALLLSGCDVGPTTPHDVPPSEYGEIRTGRSILMSNVCLRVALLPNWVFVNAHGLDFHLVSDPRVRGMVDAWPADPASTMEAIAKKSLEECRTEEPGAKFGEVQMIGQDSYFAQVSADGGYSYRQYHRILPDVVLEIEFFGPTEDSTRAVWQDIRKLVSRIDGWRE